MDLRELVSAITEGDLITARQWVADAYRSDVQWHRMAAPGALTVDQLAIAASIVELLASRRGAKPPEWATDVPAVTEPLVLDPGLDSMPRSFAYAKKHGPEPLRRRNLIALPDFLDVA